MQLFHACRRWGFSSVVPASWGDELIAGHVIRQCAARGDQPAIQCSCPRVGDRLASNAMLLEESVLWLLSPPVAVARYLRAMEDGRALHITYAGACPGAADQSIDQHISAADLLLSIGARGIDLASQPTVFENVVPPDRRRYSSLSGGFPDPQRLWEASAFRTGQPAAGDLAVEVAQMLLAGDRVLIDLAPAAGCICRASAVSMEGPTALLRAPSPVVIEGRVNVARSAPLTTPVARVDAPKPVVPSQPREKSGEVAEEPAMRSSPPRPAYRRQSTWRRQSPRPGVVVARSSAVMTAVPENGRPTRRPRAQLLIVALIVTMVLVGLWIGRQMTYSPTGSNGTAAPASSAPTTQLGRSRSP